MTPQQLHARLGESPNDEAFNDFVESAKEFALKLPIKIDDPAALRHLIALRIIDTSNTGALISNEVYRTFDAEVKALIAKHYSDKIKAMHTKLERL